MPASEDGTLNVPEAAFSVLNAIMGISVLSLPYAFNLVGILPGLIALLLIVGIMSHTGLLIGKSLRLAIRMPEHSLMPPKGRDFAFLAQAAFGEKGKSFTQFVTVAELWSALVTFMAFNIALSDLFGCTRNVFMVLSCTLAAACALLPMKIFSYLSMASSFAVFITGIAVCAVCARSLVPMAVRFVQNGGDAALPSVLIGSLWPQTFQHVGNLPRSLGIIVFCFAGHPCFPVIHGAVRDEKDWGRAINIAFFMGLVYYSAFGSAASLAFGEAVQPSVVQNLSAESARLWRYIAAVAIVIKVQLTAPLFLKTILVVVVPPMPVKANSCEGAVWKIFCQFPLMLLLSAFSGTVALTFADDVAALASLAGSLLVMVTSVLFPILVFMRLSELLGERQRRCEHLMHGLMIGLGTLMAVAGTAQAVLDLWGSQRGTASTT